ncbi:MAG: L,D-transpeptidase [Acidobacteriota bacterium]
MKKKSFLLRTLFGLLAVFIVVEIVAVIVAWPKKAAEGPEREETAGKIKAGRVESENATLRKRIEAQVPKGIYLIIDSARNTLVLRKGSKTIRQAVISCGSGSILEEPGGKRRWIFDTPRGEFQVKSKLINPTWVKPDWAFIEEGKEVPKTQDERLESGVLGDFALGFGDGYFIHGTLYTRLLGRSVTHGCIRVGDADLKAVFQAAAIGTRIYIY